MVKQYALMKSSSSNLHAFLKQTDGNLTVRDKNSSGMGSWGWFGQLVFYSRAVSKGKIPDCPADRRLKKIGDVKSCSPVLGETGRSSSW